jgi:hypothetical protein
MRFEANALGLGTAFAIQQFGATIAESEVAGKLGAQRCNLDGGAFRIGRGQRMPQSVRRPIEQGIVGAVAADQAR